MFIECSSMLPNSPSWNPPRSRCRTNGRLQLRFPASFLPSRGIMTLCQRGLVTTVMQVPAASAWACKLVRLLWQKRAHGCLEGDGDSVPLEFAWLLHASFSRCDLVFRGNLAKEAEARFFSVVQRFQGKPHCARWEKSKTDYFILVSWPGKGDMWIDK